MKSRAWYTRLLSSCFRGLGTVFGLITTLLYREMLKRNTLRPITEIINEPSEEKQRRLLRLWSRSKTRESAYIQVAGGFLFTTVASCLQWQSTQDGHWTAAASFYACMLFAFVTIVMGSQQLLVLPNDKPLDSDEQFPIESKEGFDKQLNESDKQLQTVLARLHNTSHDNHPNAILIFALQAPIMLLTLSVLAFLAGLCSIIFAPLVIQPAWNDSAKTALEFGVAAILCVLIFATSSFLLHGLFSLQELEDTPKIISWVGKWTPAPL